MALKVEDILIKMIKSIDLFAGITDDEALELAKGFVLQFYQIWSVIIKEWTHPWKIFLLKNGLLEVKKSKWLWNVVLWTINPWEIFWEMSYLNNSKTMASIYATTNSDVWEIPSSKMDFFLANYPHIKDVFYSTMEKRRAENSSKLSPDMLNNHNDDFSDIKIVI